ncbi:peptidoglycan-binding protein [Streptomyces sp. NPDC058664]|uniref:peptidoglycan-binding domain-containing protein n=1 Tax=unclassified Streptomyces TaxID=2593676 RepID=UPI0036606146
MTDRPDETPTDLSPAGELVGADPADDALVRPYVTTVAAPAAGTTTPSDMALLDGLGPPGGRPEPQDVNELRRHRRSRPRLGRHLGTAGALLALGVGVGGALYAMGGGEAPNPDRPQAGRTLPVVNVPADTAPTPAEPIPATAAPDRSGRTPESPAPSTVAPATDGPDRTSAGSAAPTVETDVLHDGPAEEDGQGQDDADEPDDGPAGASDPSPSGSRETADPHATAEPRTLSMGDTGSDVTRLQQLLHAQGFTYVTVNGTYDGATRRGVAQLQRDRDLSGDPEGVYGPVSRASLEGT